ncbi:MAG TPA: hypothetical protein VGK54_14980 [Chloroflexota bacterium]|jgi:hypothetical protein
MPILIAIVVLLGAAVAGAGAAVYGQAPECPSQPGDARSTQSIGDILGASGRMIVNDGEATTIARGYVGDRVNEARVCFTPGAGHLSGKLPLGSVAPSFYASAGVDLSGPTPRTTNLEVKVGALPNLPGVSDQVARIVSDLINQSLEGWRLDQPYAADFATGSVTVTKLGQ